MRVEWLDALAAWQQETNRRRAAERQEPKFAAAKEVGELRECEVHLLGAIAYWCEGKKDKPRRRRERISIINSDEHLVRLFMRFLGIAGVGLERCGFRVHIHERADVDQATQYWATVVEVAPKSFQKPIIKRHKPKTKRKNLGDSYRGCLQVTVLQSAEIYRKIEDRAYGAMVGDVAPLGLSGSTVP